MAGAIETKRPPSRDLAGQAPSPGGSVTPGRGVAVSSLGLTQIIERLEPARARSALAIVQWLLSTEDRGKTEQVVERLCASFIEAGLPLDRYGSSTSMVTAEHDAIGRIWVRGEGVTESVYVRTADEDPAYLASPFHLAAQTRQWVELWVPTTPDERFEIVASLKRQGLTHYLCINAVLANGADSWLTFATKQASGFSEQDLMLIAFVLPALTTRIDARVAWYTLDRLLRTYVGDEPHTAILAGRAKRGQVSTIRAAVLVADLRDSSGHTADLSAVQAVDLFNDLFDCLVPPIESRRGEVLKYLGDGLLAIFRESKESSCDAGDRALEAAEGTLAAIEAFNQSHPDHRPLKIGVALHYGEIAYGNVGSGSRLDFTVIGRDVAIASRIAKMNAKLGQPLLLSAAFVEHVRRRAERIGLYPARGFVDPLEIFRPSAPPLRSAALPPPVQD